MVWYGSISKKSLCKEGKRMSKEAQKSNFELAQEEANKIDLQIIDTLQKGYNFRVEAGAGSGKTYLIHKVGDMLRRKYLTSLRLLLVTIEFVKEDAHYVFTTPFI